MDWRNRIGLYGAYFLGMAGIGFTLPYLPLFLQDEGMSKGTIGLVSALAALAGLVQFPLGIWSDRLGRRKPFLVAALVILVAATLLLYEAHDLVWLAFLVVLFAENGMCRATAESLAGAEAAHLARPGEVGTALGALRFWKPIGIILVAVGGGLLAERHGIRFILWPLAVVQALAVGAALLIHEDGSKRKNEQVFTKKRESSEARPVWRDGALWSFVGAMVLFHASAAPGGVYLGLFLARDLHAAPLTLAGAFVVSMLAWMAVVRPAGRLADRVGRRPLLIAGWAAMALRLGLIAMAETPWQVLVIQVLDGLSQGSFAVLAAAWVTDRFADPRRIGQAQVVVGSALVFGSAVGPVLAGLVVGLLGYRGLFGLLAGVAALATALVVLRVPESLGSRREGAVVDPMPTESGLSTTP